MLVEMLIFNIFHAKNLKIGEKARNLFQNLAKKCFLSLQHNAGQVFLFDINKDRQTDKFFETIYGGMWIFYFS